jgi:cation diffusion facilitator CzcD-associated flavoprotein CzcO
MQTKSQGQALNPAGKVQIAIIGAGPGGICMGIKLKQAGFEDFVILERSASAGGTWANNRYPGLACDVPSHLYSYSFEPKPDWSRAYAQQAEIKTYMLHCVEKYGIGPHIRFNTNITDAAWDDDAGEWKLHTVTGDTVAADIFISALGMFNEIQWPDIPGLEEFTGEVLHTALWPAQANLQGKAVAVIGSAASAVQMIPVLAKEVRQLYVHQRTANWVLPKADQVWSEEELAEMRRDPSRGQKLRQDFWDFAEALLAYDKPDLVAEVAQHAVQNLNAVNDPETRRKLTPYVPFGSQRPLFSNEFYPAFNQPHVKLVTAPIERITPAGVRTDDGVESAVDVLILATGYAANKFLSVIDVTGQDGRQLADAWAGGPQAYLGITIAGFPNLFMLYGPNTNNGSILTMIEYQVDYVIRKLQTMRDKGIARIDVRQAVMDAYNEALQKDIAAVSVWNTVGSKYYRAASGRIVTQWPHNMSAYGARTSADDIDAFDIQYATGTAELAAE